MTRPRLGKYPGKKQTLAFSPYLYRARNLVERFFNKIKHPRRVATRYDKLAANYLAFVQLASMRLWLRVNESTSQRKSYSFIASCLFTFVYFRSSTRRRFLLQFYLIVINSGTDEIF